MLELEFPLPRGVCAPAAELGSLAGDEVLRGEHGQRSSKEFQVVCF